MANEELAKLAGERLPVSCREILDRACDKVEIIGPLLTDEARAVHLGFWD